MVGDVEDALAAGRAARHRARVAPGLFHGLGELAAARRQRLLPLPHRPRRARGGLRARGHRRRGRVHVPGASTSTRWRRTPSSRRSRATRSRSGRPASTRSSSAPRSPSSSRCRSRTCASWCRTSAAASARSRTRRWSRSRSRSRARPAGRCGSRTASPSRWSRRAATTCAAGCARPRPRDGRLLAREVECLFDTGAYADNGPRVVATGGDAAPGPYRWAAVPRRRGVRLHEPRAGRLLPRLRRDAPAVDRRVAGRRGGAARRARPARGAPRRTCCTPGEEVRAGGKPLDADLVGDVEKVAAAVGWDEPKAPLRRPRRLGRAARGRRAPGLERGRAGWRRTDACRARRRRPRWARARARRSRRSPPRRSASSPSSVTVRGADTRFTPYDRSTGASRSTTIAGLAVQRAAARHPRAARRDRRARSEHRAPTATTSALMRKHFGFAGGELIGRGEVAPDGHRLVRRGPRLLGGLRRRRRGRGRPGHRRRRVRRTATAADVGRAINPQLVERQDEGATLQGIGNALFEEMVYEDGAAAQRHAARLPRAELRGPSRRDDLRDRRERRRARPLRREGLRRGRARRRAGGDRQRARRRGRPDDRAAADARSASGGASRS